MTQKNETTFSRLLHSKFEGPIYLEKTNNPYRKGMPDFYYEGLGPILWAEHKHIEKPWTKSLLAGEICKTASWPMQRRWLVRAHDNNKQTCVIVGVGKGRSTKAYILEYPYSFDIETNKLLSLEQVTEYIENAVGLREVEGGDCRVLGAEEGDSRAESNHRARSIKRPVPTPNRVDVQRNSDQRARCPC